MLLSVFFFSFGHAAVKWVTHIPFYQLVFLRAAITIIICVIFMKMKRISFVGKNLKLLLWRGLAGTVALTAYFYSLQNMPLASAVTIQYLSPILTLLFAHFFVGEKTQKSQGIYFLSAFVGIFCVKGFDPRVSIFTLGVSLLSVVASAIAYNLVRVSKDYDHELVVVLYFPLVTLPLVGPFAIHDWVTPTIRDWGFILVIGVFTQLAQMLMTMAYHRSRASDVAIYNYLGIFVALGIGYFFFNESFSLLSIAGMVLIMISVLLSYRDNKIIRS